MDAPPPATAWSIPTLCTPTWRLKTTPPPLPSAAATPSPASARGGGARGSGSGSRGSGVTGGGSGGGGGGGVGGGGGGVLPPLPSAAGRYARVSRAAADALTPATVEALRATSREASLPLHEHLLAAYVVFFAAGANAQPPDGDGNGNDNGGGGGGGGDGGGGDGSGSGSDGSGGGDGGDGQCSGGRGVPLEATLAATLSAAASAAEGIDAAARVLATAVPLPRRIAVMRAVATAGGALEAACAAAGGDAAVAAAKLRLLDALGGDDPDATAAVWAWEAAKGRL